MPQRPPLTVTQILAWCDAHYARTGSWPRTSTADRTELPPELNLRKVDNALRLGLRTLPGGSSLAQLLAEHRGVRNRQDLPPLTRDAVLAWVDGHHERTGSWPNEDCNALAGVLRRSAERSHACEGRAAVVEGSLRDQGSAVKAHCVREGHRRAVPYNGVTSIVPHTPVAGETILSAGAGHDL
jgi:hypothetical protein